jgi:hypothetical protein
VIDKESRSQSPELSMKDHKTINPVSARNYRTANNPAARPEPQLIEATPAATASTLYIFLFLLAARNGATPNRDLPDQIPADALAFL